MSSRDRDRKKIVVPAQQIVNPITSEVTTIPEQVIIFEYSLAAIRQWEMKWHKSYFLRTREKTPQEMLDMLYCMTVNDIDTRAYQFITGEQMESLKKYMEDPHTSRRETEMSEEDKKKNAGKRTTVDDIYSSMFEARVPLECEHWHITSLLALLNDMQVRQTPPKKMKPKDLKAKHKAINSAYRKAHRH